MTERLGGKDCRLPEIGAVVLRHIAYTPIVRGYDMNKYIIQGGHPLSGIVTVSGAKNAAVAILPAALLVNGTCRIENVPDISDVRLLLEILDSMGAKIRRLSPNTLELCCTNVRDSEASDALVRRRHALAPRGRAGGVCGLHHGQERVRLRRDGAVGAGRVGRADGGWPLPACRSVPRQCEDGAGDRVEKAHRYRKFPARLHGVSCGHGPAGGGAGCRSRHMLGYCAIVSTMGSVRKKFAKKSKKCLTFGWIFDRIAEPLETGRQTTKDFERN